MKKIAFIAATYIISLYSNHLHANSELCQENNNDCTFVLLSETKREQVSEVITEASTTNENEQITQGTAYTETSEKMMMINRQRAMLPLSPFSTFKIPNTLIAIDSGLVTSTKQVLSYDQSKYSKEAWWPSAWTKSEHDITSAFKVSMVPIYRQLATEIGQEVMQTYVANFSYGNQDISSGIDNFWLNGSLKISALAQVRFLQKMNKGQLPVSHKSVEQLKEIMLIEKNEHYSFYAKTGTGTINDDLSFTVKQSNNALPVQNTATNTGKVQASKLGWYVGFVENAQGVHYFALNISRDNYKAINAVRKSIARNHLRHAGVL